MNKKLYLRRLYLDSPIYFIASLLQLTLIIALIVYVALDFHERIKSELVFHAELIIVILMLIDVLLYSYLNNFKVNILVVLEWIVVITFSGLYGYMFCRGFNVIDEEIEFGLMILRVVLQVIRLLLGLVRAKSYHQERKATINIEMYDDKATDLETSNSNDIIYL